MSVNGHLLTGTVMADMALLAVLMFTSSPMILA